MADPGRLLVVDDEQSVSITIKAILEQEGYEVFAVQSAVEALDLLAQRSFDVALVDLRLDRVDGVDLLEAIHTRQPDCVAIVLTGYASLESAVRAIRKGAYDYLTKPCDLDELKLTVARALERVTLVRALRERVADLEAANAKIRSLADDLQRRVDQATADLSRKVDELAMANARLEEAHRQRDEFISMVVHELRQPLTTVGGYAQLLARPNVPPEAQEQARAAIVTETRRLARLVQDLADVSRLTSGRFRIQPTCCDLVEIAREQVELARVSAGQQVLSLVAPERLPIVCDPDRIAQVLSNLLANAVKYAPGGEIRVTLSASEGHALVSVSDQGPGIPEDRVEAIFQPYVRLAARGAPPGSGLGLFIARGIVEAHGGRIQVESVAGAGSTFVVVLPREAAVRPAPVEETVGA